MSDTNWVGALRTVGFLYGIVSLCGGVAVFVLFVRVPSDLLSQLPPWLGRLVLHAPPWFVTSGTGQGWVMGFLAPFLAALAFVGYGLWSLGTALFGATDSLSASSGRGGEGGGGN